MKRNSPIHTPSGEKGHTLLPSFTYKGTFSLKFEKFSKKILQHSDANNFNNFRLRDMGFVQFC